MGMRSRGDDEVRWRTSLRGGDADRGRWLLTLANAVATELARWRMRQK